MFVAAIIATVVYVVVAAVVRVTGPWWERAERMSPADAEQQATR